MHDLIDFDPDELFFSTTDSKGIIQKANSVFVRLSEYPWEELVGAPPPGREDHPGTRGTQMSVIA